MVSERVRKREREIQFTDSVNQIHSIFKARLYLDRILSTPTTPIACQYLSSVSRKSTTLRSDMVFRCI